MAIVYRILTAFIIYVREKLLHQKNNLVLITKNRFLDSFLIFIDNIMYMLSRGTIKNVSPLLLLQIEENE